MSRYYGKSSVSELAVPAVLAALGSTACVDYLNGIDSVIDVEVHLAGSRLNDMPRETHAVVEIRLTKLLTRICGNR